MKQEPPLFVGGSAGRAFNALVVGAFPPMARLLRWESTGPNSLTATTGFEAALVRLAVLRDPVFLTAITIRACLLLLC
jgi:hypothetical protein